LRLFGYSRQRPTITAVSGSASALVFEERTGRFAVSVSPAPQSFSEGPDPVLRASLALRAP